MAETRPYDEWIPFFQYLAAIAAALLAVAFLAIQVRTDAWRGKPLRAALAVLTLAELAAPVFFGLIFLFPGHPWNVAGQVVGASGYVAILWHAGSFRRHRHDATKLDKWQMAGSALPVTTFSLVLWYPDLRWKAAVLVWLIFSGLTEAWFFLRLPVMVEEGQPSGQGQPPMLPAKA